MAEIANILVLDDEEDTKELFLQAFRHNIENKIYAFSFVHSREEAEILLKVSDYDIFIMDIAAVEFNITEFMKNITKRHSFMETIIVSAYSGMEILRTVMKCGAKDFIVKPLNFDELEEVIETTLQSVRARKLADYNAEKLNVISGEINLSAQLQKSILPGNGLKNNFLEIWADSVPTAEVGGDFYDFFWLSETKLGIVIADVSGKNISAAMFAVITKTLIKTFAKICDAPSECFENVNDTLCGENLATMFVTAMYGIFDLSTHQFTYTNAGHWPIIDIKPHSEPKSLECDTGMALGVVDNIKYIDNTIDIVPGEMLLLYTDGVTEAANNIGEEFELTRLLEVIKNSSLITPKLLTEKLFRDVKVFSNGAPQSDDITTLCFKYKPKVVRNVT